jgi:hypothetical protein
MPITAHITRQEPVFILSPMRSYSTVTIAILAGHPALYGFPELLIFSGKTIGEIFRGILLRVATGRPDARASGICRAVAEIHEGSQQEDAIGRALDWLMERTDWPTDRLFDHLAQFVYPRVPVEKSPDTVMNDTNLSYCMAAYPNARYIHLTRHPVTAQRSVMEQLRFFTPRLSRKVLAARAASVWYLSHLRIVRALEKVPEDRWHRVRAEDILATPEDSLTGLLTWLGLATDSEIIARMLRTEDWTYAGTGPTGGLFGGDHKFMLAPALRPQVKNAAMSFGSDLGLLEEMCARMTRLAAYLGYSCD